MIIYSWKIIALAKQLILGNRQNLNKANFEKSVYNKTSDTDKKLFPDRHPWAARESSYQKPILFIRERLSDNPFMLSLESSFAFLLSLFLSCRQRREEKKGDEKKCNNSVSQRQRRSLFFVVNLLQNPSRRSFLTEAPQGDISHDALCSSRPDKQMALMQVFENEIRKKTGKKGEEGCF